LELDEEVWLLVLLDDDEVWLLVFLLDVDEELWLLVLLLDDDEVWPLVLCPALAAEESPLVVCVGLLALAAAPCCVATFEPDSLVACPFEAGSVPAELLDVRPEADAGEATEAPMPEPDVLF
jgi:hypothetical protein